MCSHSFKVHAKEHAIIHTVWTSSTHLQTLCSRTFTERERETYTAHIYKFLLVKYCLSWCAHNLTRRLNIFEPPRSDFSQGTPYAGAHNVRFPNWNCPQSLSPNSCYARPPGMHHLHLSASFLLSVLLQKRYLCDEASLDYHCCFFLSSFSSCFCFVWFFLDCVQLHDSLNRQFTVKRESCIQLRLLSNILIVLFQCSCCYCTISIGGFVP